MKILLPGFAENLDEKFRQFERVYILGDLHDNENLFKSFLLTSGIGFIFSRNDEQLHIDSIDNYFLKPGVLLVFIGDVLYKTKGHFKSIARFILNNSNNCLLILGNNEVKFVYEHIKLFLDVAQNILPHKRYIRLQQSIMSNRSFEVVNTIYSIIDWVRCSRESKESKLAWHWYYECLTHEFQIDKNNCEDLMILMYILTESVVLGFSSRLKLILLHAGLNPNRALCRQKIVDICNIRNVKGTETPWFWHYRDFDFRILFGHWSALTVGKQSVKPYVFENSICLDTGCCYTNVLTYASFSWHDLSEETDYHLQENIKYCRDHTFIELKLSSTKT